MRTKKVALYGMFLGVALIFSYVEHIIPIGLGIPGIKLGLANIVTMIVLFTVGLPGALLVSGIRIILSGLLFGSLFSMIYSAAGAVLSILSMEILRRMKRPTMTTISIVGGLAHNVGQIIVASLILETTSLVYYLPILMMAGLIAGAVVGILSGMLLKRVVPVMKQYME